MAYRTHKIVYKFRVSIYKRENAINIEVQHSIVGMQRNNFCNCLKLLNSKNFI